MFLVKNNIIFVISMIDYPLPREDLARVPLTLSKKQCWQKSMVMHRQWFRVALLRATQYCSSWDNVNEEWHYIELTFLANGYSLDLVKDHLRQFFARFNPIELHTPSHPHPSTIFRYFDIATATNGI